jgi:TP901 family phage tail tape measure protein
MTMASDRQVKIVITASAAQALSQFKQVEAGLKGIDDSGKKASSIGDKLKAGLQVAGLTTGIAAVGAAFVGVVKGGLDFDASLNTLQAVSGASASKMGEVSTKAKALGNDLELPGASASDAAEAMTELAKGGLSVDQAMTAAKGTLQLAAAAQISGAQAATIQSSALNAFGLSADNAGKVADVLANVANQSAGEITDFAAGMQQSAAVAHQYGISLEDNATALGLFANAGIKGSDAGTSFKTMLTALASPTKQQTEALQQLGIKAFDANGKFVGMRSVTEQLTEAKKRMSQQDFLSAASTAFGTDAVRAASVVAEGGVAAWDKMSAAVGKSGGAAQVAAAQAQGLGGKIGEFSNAVQNASLSIYEGLKPALETIVSFGTTVISAITPVVSLIASVPGPVLLMVGAFLAIQKLGGVGNIFKTVAVNLQNVLTVAQGSEGKLSGLKSALASIGSTLATGGAFALAGAVMAAWGSNAEHNAAVTQRWSSATDDLAAALKAANGQWDSTVQAVQNTSIEGDAMFKQLVLGGVDYATLLKGVAGDADALAAAQQQARDSGNFSNVQVEMIGVLGQNYKNSADNAKTLASAAADAARGVGGLADSTRGGGASFKDEASSAQDASSAISSVKDSAGAAVPVVQAMSDAMKLNADNLALAKDKAETLANNSALSQMMGEAKAKTDAAGRALQGFTLWQEQASTRNETLDDTTANFTKSLTGLGEAFKAGTKAAGDNAAAGNLNMDALNNWDVAALTATSDGASLYDSLKQQADQHIKTVAAVYSNTAATGDLSKANSDARAAADSSRTQFVALASQYMGGNVPAAEALADRLGILDGQHIDDKQFKVISDDAQAWASFARVQSMEFAQKVVELTGSPASTVGGSRAVVENGGMMFAADGLLYGRGQSQLRMGSGGGVTWAEGITGKEYYLSMKAGMESRNRKLAAAAVADLGGHATFGDVRAGTFIPPSSSMSPAAPAAPQGGSGGVIHIELSGDGVITDQMLRTARVTAHGALADARIAISRLATQAT